MKKIVDAHQGRLEILDNPDKGVTCRESVGRSAEVNRLINIMVALKTSFLIKRKSSTL